MANKARNNRLKFLREQYGVALVNAFLADNRNVPFCGDWIPNDDGRPLSDEEAANMIFPRYQNADPTRTGACTQWLIRLAIAGNLPAEDLPKARETLEAFLAYKRRLPADQRDLGRYETLGAVWTAVEPFVRENMPASGKDEKRRERDAARAESEILLEQDGWIVAIPKTERAACWWGRGTRWCTAADKDNMFDLYNDQGPLVVFVRPDGAKFQFHAQTESFMDARDCEAEEQQVLDAFRGAPSGSPMAGLHAAMMPKDEHAVDDYVIAVADYGLRLRYAPARALIREICLAAVARDGRDLNAVPGDLIDQEMCEAAVRSRAGEVIPYIPESLLSKELCLTLVRMDGLALQSIPHRLRDRDVCLEAVRQRGMSLQVVPVALRDKEICLAAIRNRGFSLTFVPQELRDRDLCLEAVRNGGMLKHVPVEYRDREICLTALVHHLPSVEEVPEDVLDKEMCLSAVRRSGMNLSLIPVRFRDLDVCLAAVERDAAARLFVPTHIATVEFNAEAARRNAEVLELLGEEMLEKVIAFQFRQLGISPGRGNSMDEKQEEPASSPM